MTDSVTPALTPPAPSTSKRFLTNVLWSWLGVAANLAVGILLSRYIIHKMGEVRYGIWALIFSILDYFWFFDLGLNTAVANFCARYEATNEPEKINEVINTALFYFSMLSIVIITLVLAFSSRAEGFFHISPAYQKEFSTLIRVTGISWGLCMVLHMFVSALDGFQRFDLTSRVWVAMLVLRSTGYFLVVRAGYGLVEMAVIFVIFQVLGYMLNFRNFRQVFRKLRFARSLVRYSVFRQILRYGLHSFLANASNLMLNQSGPVLIGHFKPTEFVGFYSLPSRLLQYAVDAVARIGTVTRSSAAELGATGRKEAVLKLGIYSNRYSFTLFMPLVILLLVYGRELILRWVGPAFAANSAPLLPILLLATALVLAGQFNSSSILFGLSLHGAYARGLMVEAALNVLGLIFVIPRFGILGAAYVSSCLMLAVRGIYTPFLVCRGLDYSFFDYLRQIYMRPVLTGAPLIALAYFCKLRWIPGRTWAELILVTVSIGLLYSVAALFTCIEREHRALLLGRIPIVGRHLAAVVAG